MDAAAREESGKITLDSIGVLESGVQVAAGLGFGRANEAE